MARKRTKKLENGDSAHLYISQQVPAELLDYLNKQSDLSNFFMYAAVKLYEQTGNVDVANFMPRRFALSDTHPIQVQPTPTTQYVVQQPIAQEQMMQQVQQQVQQPIVQEPIAQQPMQQQPIVQEPMVQQQVQQPIVQEPIPQQQVQQPIVQEQMPQQQVEQHPLSSPIVAEVTESDEDNSDDQWEGLNGFSADQLKNMNF